MSNRDRYKSDLELLTSVTVEQPENKVDKITQNTVINYYLVYELMIVGRVFLGYSKNSRQVFDGDKLVSQVV